jgi:glycosyltransferase involved in cell wall biosynthesis
MHLPAKLLNDTGKAEAIVDRQFRMDQDILVVQRQLNPDVITGIKYMQHHGIPVLYWIEDQVWLLPFTSPVRGEYKPKAQQDMLKIINACDGVLCSSQPLANFVSRANDNVHVLPHIMLRKWYKSTRPKTKRTDGEVRILWTTTAHHHHDFEVVEHALKDVTQTFTNTKVILWGYVTKRISEMIPPSRLEYYGWIPVEHFYRVLASMEADIGICPLEAESTYNQAKTPLKFLEYGLMGICPVVSNVKPYSVAEHMKTAWKPAKNKHAQWRNALFTLVQDAELRNTIASNAHKWVWDNHTDSRIDDYVRIYESTIAKAKEKYGEKKEPDA